MGGTAVENDMEERDRLIEKLKVVCRKLNITKSELDELTYTMYRDIASHANKRGIDTQLADAEWHIGFETVKKNLEDIAKRRGT
jgi:hypothetical protein